MKKYIVIEWIHGSGKTSVAKKLVEHLCELWYKACYYHFPNEEDILGKAIRSVVADSSVCKHWQVTWLLYAAFANRFHIQTQDDDVIYVTDRHSVTTWLIFQNDISDALRQEIYSIGIHALQNNGIGFYINTSLENAQQRAHERNISLRKQGGVWQDKANDVFVAEKFQQLARAYDAHLVQKSRDIWIVLHEISNDGSLEKTVAAIMSYLV